METSPRIRFYPPTPRGDISPFLPEAAVQIHTRIVCSQLASELNLLLDGYPSLCTGDTASVLAHTSTLPRILRQDVRFAAGGLLCHSFFFRFLSDTGGQSLPDPDTAAFLRDSFGSSDSFFYIFREEAQRMRGSGFLWLCSSQRAGGRPLCLFPTGRYDLPPPSLCPILALDLWEHAYFTTYGEDRRAYADAFLRQLDWQEISRVLHPASAVSSSACPEKKEPPEDRIPTQP